MNTDRSVSPGDVAEKPAGLALGRAASIVLALVLFAAVYALRASDAKAVDGEDALLVAPLALLALQFGVAGGIAGSALSLVAIVAWTTSHKQLGMSVGGYLSWGVAFASLGVLIGWFVERRRRLEQQLASHFKQAEERLASQAMGLEAQVAERTRELEHARTQTLRSLARAAEYRDDDTFEHTERVGKLAVEIGAGLGLDEQQLEVLRMAAPLHDVGKIGIPDSILLKPEKLSLEENEIMKTHTALGAELLGGSGGGSPMLEMATVIAETHHERWDGEGYPNRLAGESIPLVGRIVAVADVFDALTHDRPYKQAWSQADAVAEIESESGAHFDPRVVRAFLDTPAAQTEQPAAHPERPAHSGRSEHPGGWDNRADDTATEHPPAAPARPRGLARAVV